ncbi:cysteine desulfurase [Gurleya vavrai]
MLDKIPQNSKATLNFHKPTNNKLELPKSIYLDYQATTPLDPRVLDSMLPYLTSQFGNPSSRTHKYGWDAENAVKKARHQIADVINCSADEIIFVSGATEANNIALKGLARYKIEEMNCQEENEISNDIDEENKLEEHTIEINNITKDDNINKDEHKIDKEKKNKKIELNKNKIYPHFITAQTEHKSVLATLRDLESEGVEVTYLKVNENGLVDLEDLKKAIKKNTVCVSLMAVNNEIGVVQDLYEIGKICKENNLVFHTDAAQGFGKIDIDVEKMNIGMMGISGHKIYGPKGVGALFLRKRPRIRVKNLVSGGGQERNIRSGTVPTPLVVGMGNAAELCRKEMKRDFEHVSRLSKRLEIYLRKNLTEVIKNGVGGVKINEKNEMETKNINSGDKNKYVDEIFDKKNNNKNRMIDNKKINDLLIKEKEKLKGYPGCLNLSFAFVEGEGLMMALNKIALSSGSACTSASLEPSYTLRALGTDDDLAHSSIRYGIGRFTSKKEIEEAGKQTVEAVRKLREMSPLYEMAKEGIDLKKIEWTQ